MTRYVDADALIETLKKTKTNSKLNGALFRPFLTLVEIQSTADVVPKSKADRLEYTLLGVMHFVDKWLDGEELEKDEVSRATIMREKTLQIVEKLTEENEKLKDFASSKCEECAGCTADKCNCANIEADTVRKMQERLKERLAMYSHIHRYAEEAKKTTEEYADGSPVEMTSVWDACQLEHNGYDDYETMCHLQENIENIAKSRLLKEFEGDVDQIAKEMLEKGDTE